MRARALIIGAALLALAGCGSSSKKSDTAATTTTVASAGGVTVPPTTGTTVNIVVGDTQGLDGPMTMTVDPATAPAGSVTFVVKNTGTVDHEVVVLKTDVAYTKLPITTFDGEPNRVDEADSVGETSADVKPGETGSFTLDMTAGKYVLVCNLAKHYGLGMRAPFTVT